MKVVSLCPSITDSVFRLGCGDALVGRTKFCVQPRGEIERVERVGGTKNPHIDRIIELRPDVVFMNEEENRKEDADALAAAGLRVCSTFARDVDGAVESLVQIGDALGVDAQPLARSISERAAELAASVRRRSRFAYLIWRDPLMGVGPGTYIDSLLGIAGGDNVVTGDRYPTLDRETLVKADRILLSSEPFPFKAAHGDALAVELGIERERFVLVDGELLSWHGVKTLEGLAYAAQLMR